MPYAVRVFDRTGEPVAPHRSIEAPTFKAAMVAATLIDGREGGHCTIHGPSGAFITSTQKQPEEADDQFSLG